MSALFWITYAALWLTTVFLALVVLALVRTVHNGRYSVESGIAGSGFVAHKGALTGAITPDFTATDIAGNIIDSTQSAGRSRSLVFVSSACPACAELLDRLEEITVDDTLVLVVCADQATACRALAERHTVAIPMIADPDRSLHHQFGVVASPTVVDIGQDGTIGPYRTLTRPQEGDRIVAAVAQAVRQVSPTALGPARP